MLSGRYTILTKVDTKLTPYTEAVIADHQCECRGEGPTTDQLSLIMEKCYEYNVTVHQLYIDSKVAYDSICRGQLLELGVPKN